MSYPPNPPPGRRPGEPPPRKQRNRHLEADDCKAALDRAGRCTWPGCDNHRASRQTSVDFDGIPLCSGHMFEVWRICRDQADTRNNRDATITTSVDGTVKTLERPVSRLGWIYYLRIGDNVKIGYASILLNRLKSYPPTSEFLYAHRGTKTDEKVAHSMVYLHKVAGREWFADHPEVHAYIETQKLRHGPKSDPRIKPTHDTSGVRIKQQRVTIVRG